MPDQTTSPCNQAMRPLRGGNPEHALVLVRMAFFPAAFAIQIKDFLVHRDWTLSISASFQNYEEKVSRNLSSKYLCYLDEGTFESSQQAHENEVQFDLIVIKK